MRNSFSGHYYINDEQLDELEELRKKGKISDSQRQVLAMEHLGQAVCALARTFERGFYGGGEANAPGSCYPGSVERISMMLEKIADNMHLLIPE